jgi:O-antigen ligase
VALIFGRILPIPLAVVALGAATRRRWLYGLALLPMLAAFGLTFSKGGLLLGLPAALLVIAAFWLAQHGRRVWPWLAGLTAAGALLFLAVRQLPALSARLDLFGVTTVLRIDLWRASWQMFIDNFWTGVGLDNFLTQYRGRYIFADAWREPDLSHPHNLWLDLGTRLGIFGIISGTWLLLNWARLAWTQRPALPQSLRPLAAAALAALAALVVHGMVDHSLFLVDLAYAFYFWLGLLMWLQSQRLPQ